MDTYFLNYKLIFRKISNVITNLGHLGLNGPRDNNPLGGGDQTYATLIFTLLDKARPKSEGHVDRDGNDQKI